jgi:hypothetical protein
MRDGEPLGLHYKPQTLAVCTAVTSAAFALARKITNAECLLVQTWQQSNV